MYYNTDFVAPKRIQITIQYIDDNKIVETWGYGSNLVGESGEILKIEELKLLLRKMPRHIENLIRNAIMDRHMGICSEKLVPY